MKDMRLFLVFVLLFPVMARAQETVQSLSTWLIDFLNTSLVPFLFAIALFIFIYYMVRYFIIDINDADGRERARDYAVYSIFAFVLMVSVWGIVNLTVAGIGLGREEAICPDTVPLSFCNLWSGGGAPGSSPIPPSRPGDGGGDGGGISAPPLDDGGEDSVGTGGGTVGTQLDENVDNATVDVINAINSSFIAGDPVADEYTSLLSSESIPDEVKMQAVEDMYAQGVLSWETADAYRDAINQYRTYNGDPFIFIDLPQEPTS